MTSERLPRTVIALGFTSLLTDVAGELVFPLLPLLLASMGTPATTLGLLEGLADAAAALVKYVAGAQADRRSTKRPFVFFGYGLTALVRPMFALATLSWHVVALRVADRVGKGIRSAPRDALIAAAVPPESAGRAFGFHRAMDHAGAVIGPLIAWALLSWGLSLRTVLSLTLIPGVLAVVALFMTNETPRVDEQRSVHASSSEPLSRRLVSLLGIFVVFALVNSSDAFLLLRAKELGVATPLVPVLWAVLHVSKMGWSLVGGREGDRRPKHQLIIAGWAVYASVYAAFAFASQAWHAWVLFMVYGAFFGLTEPVEKALIRQLAPKHAQGRAFGLYHASLGASAIPAGLLTGWLWQSYGSSTALAVGAFGAAVATVLLLAWQRLNGNASTS